MIRPIIEYGDVLFPDLTQIQSKYLELIQRHVGLFCTSAYLRTPQTLLLNELGWEELSVRRKFHCLVQMYKIQTNCVPHYLSKICPPTRDQTSQYSLRNSQNILPIFCKYACFKRSFFPFTIHLWNSLDLGVRQLSTVNMNKTEISNTLLSKHDKLLSSFHGRGSINHTNIRLG